LFFGIETSIYHLGDSSIKKPSPLEWGFLHYRKENPSGFLEAS
jgi:hypothetical protein